MMPHSYNPFRSKHSGKRRSSGYVPNKIIRLRKWLRDEKRALRIHQSKSASYIMNNIDKEIRMKNRIEELKQKIEKRGYTHEHGRIY